MAEIIHGYELLEAFKTANAGTASWTIAKKDERRYFLKRFDSPKYSESSKKACHEYEEKKTQVYQALAQADSGNIIFVKDFFREGACYYTVTEYIDNMEDVVKKMHALDPEKRRVAMRVLAHSMMRLEEYGIVHSDLKPSNIIVKPTIDDYCTVKLIDFDSGFLQNNAPDPEDIEGDLSYYSPEALRALCGDEVAITSKADVFALGIMFHQFLTGEMPELPSDEFDYLNEAVLSGMKPVMHPSVPEEYRVLIEKMLTADPEERLSFKDVFKELAFETEEETEEIDEPAASVYFDDEVPAGKIEKDDDSELFKALGDL